MYGEPLFKKSLIKKFCDLPLLLFLLNLWTSSIHNPIHLSAILPHLNFDTSLLPYTITCSHFYLNMFSSINWWITSWNYKGLRGLISPQLSSFRRLQVTSKKKCKQVCTQDSDDYESQVNAVSLAVLRFLFSSFNCH